MSGSQAGRHSALTQEILLSRAGEKRINRPVKTFQSWFFRILWWLTFLVIVLVVLVLSNQTRIVRELAERQIRAATGMEPEIGDLSFGVMDPYLTFDGFKLYNPTDFGGTLFLDVPELHIEYDRAALRRHELHITFMRVNLHELDVVRNDAGVTNIASFANLMAPQKSGNGDRIIAPLNGYKFTGIDVLNLSIGTVKFINLKEQYRNRMVTIGLQDQIYTNVLSPADLPGLSGQLWIHGGYLVGLPVHAPVRKTSPEPAPKKP
jgi:hypothetical protein